jgi:hypothetical protein
MKLIAHRGLVDGPNSLTENSPQQIEWALSAGFDSEIDVWYVDGSWWLGHDQPQYNTNLGFLSDSRLWIHAKNDGAAFALLDLTRGGHKLNFFWHDKDERTLTSMGFWWTFPKQSLGPLSVAVMPEWHVDPTALKLWTQQQTCFAVCSDFVGKIKE